MAGLAPHLHDGRVCAIWVFLHAIVTSLWLRPVTVSPHRAHLMKHSDVDLENSLSGHSPQTHLWM